MKPTHAPSVLSALYSVFVVPSLQIPRAAPVLPKAPTCLPRPTTRSFTTTHVRPAKTRAPEQRAQKWNEEIRGSEIILVNIQTNELSEPRSRRSVLANLNKDTHRLVQVAVQPDPRDPDGDRKYPVCKILDKKEMYQLEKSRKDAQKEAKKASAVASSVKTMELNWAIDGNDLGHRLDRIKEFLASGRKVEIVLAAKKAGRKANQNECEDVLKRIRGAVEAVPGAREAKPLEGKIGGFCTILFQGKPPQAQPGQNAAAGQKTQQKGQNAAAG